ncbi:MAG: polysaccharide deacetylase family protein [Saccharospirillaceae bacterium]|nr:polysaccharide deacetylase family protein [Pseudomonadales bacterium]NRB81368.1 polysaccharide deacetylase family protein [Saccharospirillaceae bacterium]
MIKSTLTCLALFLFCAQMAQAQNYAISWPGGQKVAVSLSYDDALASQLDNALPELDKYNFKGSFYVLPNSKIMASRLEEWRALAQNAHELGNHSMYHSCRASLPNREWVEDSHDLDHYSIKKMIGELIVVNTFLQALDGKTQRTYTTPCGDLLAGGEPFLNEVKDLFIAIKSPQMDHKLITSFSANDQSAASMIASIRYSTTNTAIIDIVFHGVGGDYLTTSTKAHAQLLAFLDKNRDTYYVDTFINLMSYAQQQSE